MPTQAQLDAEQSRTEARSETIGKRVKSGGIYDLSTRFVAKPKRFPQTGKRNLQDDGIDFVSRERVEETAGGGG